VRSRDWLDEHFKDPYVKRAREQGYRSRAAFKLLEIQEKDHILKSGMAVIDLGAAPGGWSQVAAKLVKPNGIVFALDLLAIEPIEGVDILQGDFTEPDVLDALREQLQGRQVDVMLSDMAPNTSGIRVADQAAMMYLLECALFACQEMLKPGGTWVAKVFQGSGFDDMLRQCRTEFERVVIRKPKASRPRSKEVYFVAKGYRGSRDEIVGS